MAMNIMEEMVRRRREWTYRLAGPSTLHLKHEACLLASLAMLTISSLSTLYKYSSGTRGDTILVGISTLWLSRHLVIRWVCTHDRSTNSSPTLLGALAHLLTSHINGAGQYFDRPSFQVVGKHIGTINADDGRTSSFTASQPFPWINYLCQYLKIRILYPFHSVWNLVMGGLLTKINGDTVSNRQVQNAQTETAALPDSSGGNASGSGSGNGAGGGGGGNNSMDVGNKRGGKARGGHSNHDGNRSSKKKNQGRYNQRNSNSLSMGTSPSSPSSMLTKFFNFWWKLGVRYGPPLQMLIPLLVAAFYLWHLVLTPAMPEDAAAALAMNHQMAMAHKNGTPMNFDQGMKPHGTYKRLDRPEWRQVIFFLSCGGTLASIFLFGRIFLPIPDLVAGCNVLKAVRNEAKSSVQSGPSKSKSRMQRENNEMPWAERHKSIANENRFRLICKAASIRIFENIFLCIFFPRTGFACRATGQCSEGTPIWELSKVLYFSGITSVLREDIQSGYQLGFFAADRTVTVLCVISVVLITMSVLMAQSATLSRSYLAIMGHLAGEWTVIDKSDPSLQTVMAPSPWDPRRRYKKGDIIVQQTPGLKGQLYYKAVSNSPEGRPLDLYLRASHDFFRNELGSPVRSEIITHVSALQLVFISLLLLIFCWYRIMDHHSGGLLWIIFANIMGLFATLSVGLPNYTAVEQLAAEIST